MAILDLLTDCHVSSLLRPTIHRHLSLFSLLTSEQQLSSRLDVAGSQGTRQGSRDNEGTDPLPLADSISTGTLSPHTNPRIPSLILSTIVCCLYVPESLRTSAESTVTRMQANDDSFFSKAWPWYVEVPRLTANGNRLQKRVAAFSLLLKSFNR